MRIACSACLLGIRCRYDGEARPSDAAIALRKNHEVIPVCPERLGGLRAPRAASEIDTTLPYPLVRDADGIDVTDAFIEGARKTCAIAVRQGCEIAVMKEKSPSCGVCRIFDGRFSGRLVDGSGLATRRLREEGIRVISDEMLHTCTDAVFATSSSQTPVLTTERLVLRPLTPDDCDDLFSCCRDPSVGPAAGWTPHRSREDTLAFINGPGAAPHVFGIVLADTGLAGSWKERCGHVIGSIGLIGDPTRRNPDCRMIGYSLQHELWGRGYTTEAAQAVIRYGFMDLGLSLITAQHYPGNFRSASIIGTCGLISEGMLRQVEPTPDGRMSDVLCSSMTRAEYLSGHHGEPRR